VRQGNAGGIGPTLNSPIFFAPLREISKRIVSRKGAKAQRKYEEVVASLGVLGVLGGLKFFLRREFPNRFAQP
jgi:hypothetical protein